MTMRVFVELSFFIVNHRTIFVESITEKTSDIGR
tara:strand:- start:106523 stop:106624 length:102 start_codon:yes stop_codon:yes gene_type:complete